MLRFGCVVAGSVAMILTAWTPAALAQFGEEQLGVPTDLKRFPDSVDFNFNRSLRDGESLVRTEQGKQDCQLCAKYYIYRVTWLENVNDPAKMEKAVAEFQSYYENQIARSKKIDQATAAYISAQMAECLRQVLARPFESNRISTINGAQLLPILAKGKFAEVGDLLTELIENAKVHDAVKLYAVRALREYFPLQVYGDLDLLTPIANQRKDRNVRQVRALMNFIERSWPKTDDAQEIEAIRYLRREAVASLALAEVPVIVASPKKKTIEAPVAPTLLKVLAKDALTPPPSLAEKCEAALGICNLRLGNIDPKYEPALGVLGVGHCLAEYLSAYRADYAVFRAPASNVPPLLPWRSLADRFVLKSRPASAPIKGLEHLISSTSDAPQANALAKQLHAKCGIMFDRIRRYEALDNQQAANFSNWIAEQEAPQTDRFQGVKGSKLDLTFGTNGS